MTETFYFLPSEPQRRNAWRSFTLGALAWSAMSLWLLDDLWPTITPQWLLFSTLGLVALFVILRVSLREQSLSMNDEGLEVRTRMGPWARRLVVPRSHVLDVLTDAGTGALSVHTPRGAVTLVSVGSKAALAEAQARLRAMLDLGHLVHTTLPSGFEERPEDGSWVLERVLRGRVWWFLVGVLGLVAGHSVSSTGVMALSAIVLAGAVVREEWVVGPAVLAHRWRVGPFKWSITARLTGLQVQREEDSDGDAWFRLLALGPEGPRVVLRSVHSAEPPATLAEHLAKRAGLRVDYGEGCEVAAPSHAARR